MWHDPRWATCSHIFGDQHAFLVLKVDFFAIKAIFWCQQSIFWRSKRILGQIEFLAIKTISFSTNQFFGGQSEFLAPTIEFLAIKTNFCPKSNPGTFVSRSLSITLVTLYQGPQPPGDSILEVSLQCPCGGIPSDATPGGRLVLHLGPCGHHGSPLKPHVDPIGIHLGPMCTPSGSSGAIRAPLEPLSTKKRIITPSESMS